MIEVVDKLKGFDDEILNDEFGFKKNQVGQLSDAIIELITDLMELNDGLHEGKVTFGGYPNALTFIINCETDETNDLVYTMIEEVLERMN
jgi:hypothetical protein